MSLWPSAAGIRWLPLAAALIAMGCAKSVQFRPTALARGGTGTAKVELTYDRNNSLEIRLSNVAEPSTLKPETTRYVLWVTDPGRQRAVNAGQLRVDEKKAARIQTLTPMRRFILFITVEAAGDAASPSAEIIFESPLIEW